MKITQFKNRLVKAGRIPSFEENLIMSLISKLDNNAKVKPQNKRLSDRAQALSIIQKLPKAIKSIYIN